MGCGASQCGVVRHSSSVGPSEGELEYIVPSEIRLNDDGSIINRDFLLSAIAKSGGLAPELRVCIWPLLLGITPWEAGADAIAQTRMTKASEFDALVERSTASPDAINPNYEKVISGDVTRTDRDQPQWVDESSLSSIRNLLMAHCLHSEWGYYQGMSDIAAVVLSTVGPSRSAHVPPGTMDHGQPQLGETTTGGTPSRMLLQRGDASLAFWVFEAVLTESQMNWKFEGLKGVWRQARAVLSAIRLIDPPLAKRLLAIETSTLVAKGTEDQCLLFLFQPILLRLKREMRDYEQVCRLWEVSWASGGINFFILILVGYIRAQRTAIMRLRPLPASMADLHRIFISLVGQLDAAPLLVAARKLEEQHPNLKHVVRNQLASNS